MWLAWSMAGSQIKETSGCGWRTLGLMYDGWRAGGCGRLSPPHLIFGSYLAINGWVIPPSLVLEQSDMHGPEGVWQLWPIHTLQSSWRVGRLRGAGAGSDFCGRVTYHG